MSVHVEPAEVLTFKRPLTRTSKEILTISNSGDHDIAFKVKTTAPKLYCVRPNAGTVTAGETMEIQVMLQPFKEEPPLDQKCKDKFLVQSVPITEELKSLESIDLWAHVESKSKGSINQIKLRCDYAGANDEKNVVERSPSESTVVSHQKSDTEQFATDEVSKLRLELDAYKNELETLRCRAPDAAVVKKNGVPLPVVVAIALISVLVSFVLFRQSS
ncbi:PapD-like protein [Absidia repens]|uniref:PapD-like protein n=1 Tax=Absidia repens TaxID=90262 RepID=A0A1X2I5Z2_9FUNG|nr:PapD-like protein [Absidia repens]